ncbi:hypothetical protein OH492_00955 [Vibrio chagasii]|nr:hypothetical protein [Vibrio chagasii]
MIKLQNIHKHLVNNEAPADRPAKSSKVRSAVIIVQRYQAMALLRCVNFLEQFYPSKILLMTSNRCPKHTAEVLALRRDQALFSP